MALDQTVGNSLYDRLGEQSPPGSMAGQTNITKAKETMDDDVERFAVEELLYGG